MRIERENNQDTASVVEHMFPGVELSDLPHIDLSCTRATIKSINKGGLVLMFPIFRHAIHTGQSHTERELFGRTLDQFWAGYRMLGIEPPFDIADHKSVYNNTSFVEFLEPEESLAGVGRMKVSMPHEQDAYISVIGVTRDHKPTGLIYHISGVNEFEKEDEIVRRLELLTPAFNM